MKNKSLSFTKSDILNALVELIEDKEFKGIVVENLLVAKISRLRNDASELHEEFDNIMGGVKVTRKSISTLSDEQREILSLLTPKINNIVDQINEYQNLYDEFSKNDSFGKVSLGGFKSKLKQIFKWDGY